jgi:ABC-2 type transport system permease protein
MSNEVITKKPDSRPDREDRPLLRELAPSIVREEEPRLSRTIGTVGFVLFLLGILAVAWYAKGGKAFVSVGRGSFLLAVGFLGVLFHAASDKDLQVRRTYTVFGFLLLVAGVVLSIVRFHEEVGGLFWLGFLCISAALFFILAAVRHETEEVWRNRVTLALGASGLVMALTGLIGGNIWQGEFLLPYGLLLALLGLGYLWAFVGLRSSSDELGYRVGLGLGILGGLVFLIALGRSALPPLFFAWHWIKEPPQPYLIPVGFLLMCLGLLYVATAAGICSDNRLVVLTRRELAAFFYSPIAYIVFFGLTSVAWIFFWIFLSQIVVQPGRIPMVEPIVQHYIAGFAPIVCMIFIVPVLTMRLLSEEKRTGTLEVLLTVPVNETLVVLSKFLAALIFLLLTWLPWGLFLAALRIEDGKPFDYRPLLSFGIAMAFMGAGFMAMGLFFSSLTRNQIASSVLTFMGMMFLTGLVILKWYVEDSSPGSAWVTVLGHISYVELWFKSLEGQLQPRFLLFHLSAAILWLFMTVKVLEARRWT